MPRKKSTTAKAAEPGFEEAIARLDEIVAALEEESLPLEDMVERFEEGTRLLNRCEAVLGAARKRLKTIATRTPAEPSEDEDGKPLTPEASGDTDGPDDDDDIRLF